jgi:hypothetical protein
MAATVGLVRLANTLVSTWTVLLWSYSAPPPCGLGGLEVATDVLSQRGDQIQPTLGVHHFVECGVDDCAPNDGCESLSGHIYDISVDLKGCLRPTSTQSAEGHRRRGS